MIVDSFGRYSVITGAIMRSGFNADPYVKVIAGFGRCFAINHQGHDVRPAAARARRPGTSTSVCSEPVTTPTGSSTAAAPPLEHSRYPLGGSLSSPVIQRTRLTCYSGAGFDPELASWDGRDPVGEACRV